MKNADFRGLRLRIIASTLTFSLVPLLVLGFSIKHQFNVSYRDKIKDNLNILVENKRKSIDLFLSERVSQIDTLAQTHNLKQLSERGSLDQIFSYIQSKAKYYIDLGVIDAEGNHVAYTGPYQLKDVNYKNEEWFHQVMNRGVYISDVFTGFRRYPHFVIAVLRREGGTSWILRATIDSDIFDSLVKSVQIGKRGDAFIINDENELQTLPRFGGKVLDKIDFPLGARFSGTKVERWDVSGREFLVGTAWLDNVDWILVIKEDPGEELRPLFFAESMVYVILGLGVLCICVGTVLVSNKLISRIIMAEREKSALDASLTQSNKMAALGKMAAGVAHEINNPLAIIKEKAGWLKDLLEDDDMRGSENYQEFKESLDKIEYHVERAKNVTHRMLGFARRMEPASEQVDINFVVNQTIKFLENEALHRNINIETYLDNNLPKTLSDTSQLQQVFLNIIDNAIDAFQGKSGVIRVSTGFNPKSGEISVAIKDSGCGISKEKLDKIFDPFFTTKKVGEGTGLGLSISFSIVAKLGGKILVDSVEGAGTTFTIVLPVKD